MISFLIHLIKGVIWKTKRFFKYYVGNMKYVANNCTTLGLAYVGIRPISCIPECIRLTMLDYEHLCLWEKVSTRKELGASLISVRSS